MASTKQLPVNGVPATVQNIRSNHVMRAEKNIQNTSMDQGVPGRSSCDLMTETEGQLQKLQMEKEKISQCKELIKEQELLILKRRQSLLNSLVERQRSVSSYDSNSSSMESIAMNEEINRLRREQSKSILKLRQDNIKELVSLSPKLETQKIASEKDSIETMPVCNTFPRRQPPPFSGPGRYSFKAYYKLHKSNTFSTKHRRVRLVSFSDDEITRSKSVKQPLHPVFERQTSSWTSTPPRRMKKREKSTDRFLEINSDEQNPCDNDRISDCSQHNISRQGSTLDNDSCNDYSNEICTSKDKNVLIDDQHTSSNSFKRDTSQSKDIHPKTKSVVQSESFNHQSKPHEQDNPNKYKVRKLRAELGLLTKMDEENQMQNSLNTSRTSASLGPSQRSSAMMTAIETEEVLPKKRTFRCSIM